VPELPLWHAAKFPECHPLGQNRDKLLNPVVPLARSIRQS